MNNICFTSDTHAFHRNIIKYCNRPFPDEIQMTLKLAENINKALPNGGLLYHLGDWSMGGKDCGVKFLNMINKNIDIVLLKGNHDDTNYKDANFRAYFRETLPSYHETHVNKQRMTLCHYALRVWNKSHHGAWHLFGHSHAGLPDDPNSLSMDVGVDAAYKYFGEYRPFTFEEVRDILSKKTFKPVDHHGA